MKCCADLNKNPARYKLMSSIATLNWRTSVELAKHFSLIDLSNDNLVVVNLSLFELHSGSLRETTIIRDKTVLLNHAMTGASSIPERVSRD